MLLAAAASLRGVVPELIAGYLSRHPGPEPIVSYGASGTLCSQVEAGAPVHAVLFAASEPVSRLVDAGLAQGASTSTLARNQLVLVGSAGGAALDFRTMGSMTRGQRLVIGNPDFVPAGRYARQLLDELGVWDLFADRLVYAGDVTRALAYVRRGEAEFGLVYATDVRGQQGLVVLDRADWQGAPRPEVVGAITHLGSAHPSAATFLDYVRSSEAAGHFAASGFARVVD